MVSRRRGILLHFIFIIIIIYGYNHHHQGCRNNVALSSGSMCCVSPGFVFQYFSSQNMFLLIDQLTTWLTRVSSFCFSKTEKKYLLEIVKEFRW